MANKKIKDKRTLTVQEGYGKISGTSDNGSLTQVRTIVMREEIIVRYVLKAKLAYFPNH